MVFYLLVIKLIDARTEESERLLVKLMGRGSKRIKSDWANASAALNEAEAFKNKLLAADADRSFLSSVEFFLIKENDIKTKFYYILYRFKKIFCL